MSEVVLDSSVLIAMMKGEQIDPIVFELIEGAVMSAVNLAEVLSKLSDLGTTKYPKAKELLALLDRIEQFTISQASCSSDLRPSTKPIGLSLGDRACLALALELGAEVYTADHAWARVDVGCIVHLIR